MRPPLPTIENPAYALARLRELRTSFESLEYVQSISGDFANCRTLVAQLQAFLRSLYGANNAFPSTVNFQFQYARAKQLNAVNYFARDKSSAITLLTEIIDEIHLKYPNLS